MTVTTPLLLMFAPSMDDFLTIQDLADLLRVPVQTVYDWRRRGYGPRAHKVGGHLRWRRSDVEAWLDSVAEGRPTDSAT